MSQTGVIKLQILFRYNSLPCGTEFCSRMAVKASGQRLRKVDVYSWRWPQVVVT